MSFSKSKKGFTVKATYPGGPNGNLCESMARCENYKETLKVVLGFMENPRVRSIRIWNNDTDEVQLINESAWK